MAYIRFDVGEGSECRTRDTRCRALHGPRVRSRQGARRAQMKRWARWLQRLRPFGIGARSSGRLRARPEVGRGCSSGVEHDLAKVGVEGSNPFARSKILNDIKKLRRPGKSGCYCCLGGEAWGKQTV